MGYKVFITAYINIQKRKHKKKRINKKWLKRFGKKKHDPSKDKLLINHKNKTIFLNQKNFDALREKNLIENYAGIKF